MQPQEAVSRMQEAGSSIQQIAGKKGERCSPFLWGHLWKIEAWKCVLPAPPFPP